MRFHCTTASEKRLAKTVPHKWFAWRPVRLKDLEECAWLETVYRVGTYHQGYEGDYFWDYKHFSKKHP